MDGLPPPPRRKSRPRTGRSEGDSPQSSRDFMQTSLPGSPTYASASPSPQVANTPSNPYINPTPRLSYLIQSENKVLTQSARATFGQDVFAEERRERHRASASADGLTMSPMIASFSPTETSESPTELQKAFSRHHRYLSSLQKVERLLGKGKGKSSSVTAIGVPNGKSSPRTSDVSLSGSLQERPSKEALLRRMLERGSVSAKGGSGSGVQSASAPSSPTGRMISAYAFPWNRDDTDEMIELFIYYYT